MERYLRIRIIASILAFAGSSGAGPATALDVVLRSGDGPIGTPDPSLHVLEGPVDGPIGPFQVADFDSARLGPPPTIRAPHLPYWIASLDSDPLAQWVFVASNGSGLYAHDFWVDEPCSSVTLHLEYAVDNYLGENEVAGVYVNGVGLPDTDRVGGFSSSFLLEREIGDLLVPGLNTLYVYAYDYASVSGLMFSARIVDSSSCDTSATEERSWGGIKSSYR